MVTMIPERGTARSTAAVINLVSAKVFAPSNESEPLGMFSIVGLAGSFATMLLRLIKATLMIVLQKLKSSGQPAT
jgi:hypothetical protein